MYSGSTRTLSKKVLELAQEQGLTIATAESCTGGLVAGALTDIPGSSSTVLGGIVSYSNSVKESCLGVKHVTLENHGAVSQETAEEMAAGALSKLGADLAVSTAGIAGPGGAVPGKPVGTVCFGVAQRGEKDSCVFSYRFIFDGSRQDVREAAVNKALELLIEALQ